MNKEKILKILNSTWRPVLQWSLVIGVILAVVIYPIAKMILSVKGINVEFPKEISENLFALLTGAGVFAAIRTAEKKFGVTDVH
jgi:hypothetical protein